MEKLLPETLTDLRQELGLLMEYAAPADERAKLAAVVDRYGTDIIALKVFHSFYSYLPEAMDDGIVELRRITNRQGVFLFSAKTLLGDYLYLADREKAEFLGALAEGIWDQEILEFFGWRDREGFLKAVAAMEELAAHLPVNEAAELCPVCATANGELHTPGCPVEVCPWCGGQLIHCPCRFDKTGIKEFSQEGHVDAFLAFLDQKGRIPFDARDQRPAYKREED